MKFGRHFRIVDEIWTKFQKYGRNLGNLDEVRPEIVHFFWKFIPNIHDLYNFYESCAELKEFVLNLIEHGQTHDNIQAHY